jgi:hypothetical protein
MTMLKHLNTLKNAAQKAQESVTGTAQRAQESVVGTAQRTHVAVIETAQKAQGAVVGTLEAQVQSAKNAVVGTIESTVLTAKDAVLDARDEALGSVVRGVGLATDIGRVVVYSELGAIPVSIAMMVAPVPVGIGVGILFLAEMTLGGSLDKIEEGLEQSKARRKFDRTVGLLQKYGKIPATSVLESEHIRLEIQSKPVSVTGLVKTGKFEGRRAEHLETHELEQLLESYKDQDTQEIVKAYQKFRSVSGASQ